MSLLLGISPLKKAAILIATICVTLGAVAGLVEAAPPNAPAAIGQNPAWNTFLGSTGIDYGSDMVMDSAGNIYIAGQASGSWGSPVRPYAGGTDGYVAKLNSQGVLQWHTYLGSSDIADTATDIAIDALGNIYIVGSSRSSWGTPIRAHTNELWYIDIFVAKLDNNGVLQWNTFLGSNGTDSGYGIALDSSANVYVCGDGGNSWGTPITPPHGSSDIQLVKLNTDGAVQWNTYIGGTSGDGSSELILDSAGNIYIAGQSSGNWGTPIRAYSGNTDVSIVKLDSGATVQWHTFLGSAQADSIAGIVLDASGNIYVSGESAAAWGTPVIPYAGNYDGFVAQISNSGSLQWHSFLGGSGDDNGRHLTLSDGAIYVTGRSTSSWGSPQHTHSGARDAFVAKFSRSGALLENTFLGGSGNDEGEGILRDPNGNIFLVGHSDTTWGTPIRTHSGNYDAFLTRLDDLSPTVLFGANTVPTNGAVLSVGPTQIMVEYSEEVVSNGGPNAANNPANYLLMEAGADHTFTTTNCTSVDLVGDLRITVNSVTYTNNGGAGPFLSTLNINGGIPLPNGTYRLFVCGTTSVQDLSGNRLNGGLADTLINFVVQPVQSVLPDTGFARGRITMLHSQPDSKAYANTEMILEIPQLDQRMTIVGVPQVDGTWDVTWLGNNAGYLSGSAFPTWAGNTVLTGHVWDAFNQPGPFAQLKTLKYGDQLYIHAWGITYIYEVRENWLLFPSRVSKAFQHEDYDYVTLLTCEFYNPFNQSYFFRRIVRAVLVEVK
jgi:LPXTG-site transpeptidase (sortase) family protein